MGGGGRGGGKGRMGFCMEGRCESSKVWAREIIAESRSNGSTCVWRGRGMGVGGWG